MKGYPQIAIIFKFSAFFLMKSKNCFGIFYASFPKKIPEKLQGYAWTNVCSTKDHIYQFLRRAFYQLFLQEFINRLIQLCSAFLISFTRNFLMKLSKVWQKCNLVGYSFFFFKKMEEMKMKINTTQQFYHPWALLNNVFSISCYVYHFLWVSVKFKLLHHRWSKHLTLHVHDTRFWRYFFVI